MRKVGVAGMANIYWALGMQSLAGIALHHGSYRRRCRHAGSGTG